ncbi:haloacid dehalogenase type II [Beijerinckia sp. L45]|uniref:haloacid dehalogenase type II n=1 Tax=Beijerinckia sp. L45 TaxID=1641855 RepID=UPI00131E67B8|nr:haloacid dehalogenase type II [Beijerinckia sp. L45]
MPFDPKTIRALAFDIQGTAVDFYSPVLRMGAAVNATKNLSIDWAAMSKTWRALYREGMDKVIAGARPWLPVEQIYREALDLLLDGLGLAEAFTPAERDAMNAVWTKLDAWADSAEGLARLRKAYTLTTLSNAGMPALISVVKHAGLTFDCVLSADLARSYKPAPAVYQLAVDCLGVAPSEILMVASHKYDLVAARAFGMRTAFVARPLEFGPDERPDLGPDPTFDINAKDFGDLADQLGA